MADKKRSKVAPEAPIIESKKTEVVSDEKSADRPKYNNTKIKCPYCDCEAEQKIKYSFSGNQPNLIECGECHYHFIVMQRVEIISTVIEIQDQLEQGSKSSTNFMRTAEAGTREASL